jgi:hypothetical protein
MESSNIGIVLLGQALTTMEKMAESVHEMSRITVEGIDGLIAGHQRQIEGLKGMKANFERWSEAIDAPVATYRAGLLEIERAIAKSPTEHS